jgi:hypothetical protein
MKLLLLFLVATCVFLIGCPSYSVHPLYTEQDAVVEPALEGTWIGTDPGDKGEITFKKVGDHEYSAASFDADPKVIQTYKVHLVRLGDQLFMDYIADEQTIAGEKLDNPPGVIATHMITKVKVSGDDLAYATLEDDAIKKQNPTGGGPLDYQITDEGAVLVTAQTDALRRYISAHAEDAFSKSEHLKRKLKAPSQPQQAAFKSATAERER